MPATTTTTPSRSPTSIVGQPIDRVDGRAKVTGGAEYAGDAKPDRCAHAYIIQSTISAGIIKSIDTSKAEQAPGVLFILTPQNIAGVATLKPVKADMQNGGVPAENRLPLSDLNIHYGGQHVAVVIAETITQARYAASLVEIQYDVYKPIISLSDPAAKTVIPEKIFGEDAQLHRGQDVDAVISAGGDQLTVINRTYTTPVESHNPMEMSATTAMWDASDRLTVWDSTQYVMGVRTVLANALGLAHENVRVLCPFVGGGFGCKGFQWPHELLAAVAAKAVGRPVKLMLTRSQMFTSCGHRPPTVQAMTLAADKDGKLVAARHHTTMHGSQVGEFVEGCGTATTRVLYACPNVDIAHIVKSMNVNTPTPMRAPGECPGTFALESAMDELAYAMHIDPLRLRLINYADIHPQSGKLWSSKYLKECYLIAAQKFGWKDRIEEPRSMSGTGGVKVGFGLATATYPGYKFGAMARIRLFNDGNGAIRAVGSCAAHDLGTGACTVFTQTTAEVVGLPVEQVKFELGDTQLPYGPVAGGSNTTASVSQAISEAASALKIVLAKLIPGDSPISGLQPNQLEIRDAKLAAKGDSSRAISLVDLMSKSRKQVIEATSPAPGTATQPSSDDAEDYAAAQKKYAFQSFGCHMVEVQVDEPLARVRVKRVVSVMDIGRVMNHKTAHSQVIGAAIMGIGMALMEGTEYEPISGRPINNSLADYPVCVNPDIPQIDTHFIDIPDPHMNRMGCRGVGEIGITGMAAAVANAIYHAIGKRVRDLPITPDKLLA